MHSDERASSAPCWEWAQLTGIYGRTNQSHINLYELGSFSFSTVPAWGEVIVWVPGIRHRTFASHSSEYEKEWCCNIKPYSRKNLYLSCNSPQLCLHSDNQNQPYNEAEWGICLGWIRTGSGLCPTWEYLLLPLLYYDWSALPTCTPWLSSAHLPPSHQEWSNIEWSTTTLRETGGRTPTELSETTRIYSKKVLFTHSASLWGRWSQRAPVSLLLCSNNEKSCWRQSPGTSHPKRMDGHGVTAGQRGRRWKSRNDGVHGRKQRQWLQRPNTKGSRRNREGETIMFCDN